MRKNVLTRGLLLTVIAVMLFAMSACGGNEDSNTGKASRNDKPNKVVDVDKAAESILSGIGFKDQMTKVDKDVIENLYLIKEKDVKKCAVYVSTGATAEELAVFEARNAKSADKILKQCKLRVKIQKSAFEVYNPDEVGKLSNSVVKKSGDYVVLCVSENKDKASELIKSALK